MYISYITYNLELFSHTKTSIFLVPCHVHKHKFNEKKNTICHFHICVIHYFKVVFKKKKKTLTLLYDLYIEKKTCLISDIH